MFFCNFSFISNVLIEIYENSNLNFNISNHKVKAQYISLLLYQAGPSRVISNRDMRNFVSASP